MTSDFWPRRSPLNIIFLFTSPSYAPGMSKRSPSHAMVQVATFAFSGIDAIPVEVQVQLSSGAPNFLIVGLADKAIAEARERVVVQAVRSLSPPAFRQEVPTKPAELVFEMLLRLRGDVADLLLGLESGNEISGVGHVPTIEELAAAASRRCDLAREDRLP